MVKPLVQRFVRRYLAPTLMSAFTDSGHSISLELRKRRGCNRPQADADRLARLRVSFHDAEQQSARLNTCSKPTDTGNRHLRFDDPATSFFDP